MKKPVLFPASQKPQRVKVVVRDIDTGRKGVVISKSVGGGFWKVRFDGKSKPSLIDPDQLAKSNPGRKRFLFKNPQYTVDANPVGSRQKAVGSKKPNPQTKFSQDSLKHLRTQFAAIDGAKVSRHRPAFDKVFAGTSRPLLKQLAEAKIEWVSPLAKDALVARRNPATKKNMHPLEIGSNVAMIIGGLDHVRTMMTRSKKKKPAKRKNSSSGKSAAMSSSKKPNLGLIDLAANLQAADYLQKALKAKKKKNPVEVVTPGKASAWLKTNKNRGDMDQKRINAMAAKMKAGTYTAKTPLLFKDGKLIDGRHRLLAVIKSGKAVKFEVERVVTPGSGMKMKMLNPSRGKLLSIAMKQQFDRPCEACGKRQSTYFGWNKKFVCTPCFKHQKPPKSTQRNPTTARAQIREDFLGREGTGKTMNLYTLPGGPKRAGGLAKLASIELADGTVQTFRRNPGDAFIGGVKYGDWRRMVIGLRQPFALPNGVDADVVHDYGEVARFDYWARKPHLYGEKSPEFRFTHKCGEEGGRRPHLIVHNGCIGFRRGAYDILKEGVRD